MVAGHLQIKKDYYYAVLNIKGTDGRRKTKWIPTGLPAKGNKKRAEAMLNQLRKEYIEPRDPAQVLREAEKDSLTAAEFLKQWIRATKQSLAVSTYASYFYIIDRIMVPYFTDTGVTLTQLEASDITDFYSEQYDRVKASTVAHYHMLLNKALKYAVKMELIRVSPMEKVDRPKSDRFIGSFYNRDELKELFEAVKGHKLETAVMLGAFYGLRRSEVIGLRWNMIDFSSGVITINHTVTSCSVDGKLVEVAKDRTKTASSMRSLPLVEPFRVRLQELKKEQELNRRLCGKSYNKEYLEYVCVDEMGNRMKPNYLTTVFPQFLESKGLRRIRYHDLRHSCASLLLANGVQMKQIQEWLGHSDFNTTANFYAHLESDAKNESAKKLSENLDLVSLT